MSSPEFAPDATIPERFSCNGAGDRPALRFGGVPSAATELALLVIDPDAGGFVPCPPSGMHRYQFALYWLRARSKLAAGADPQKVDAIQRSAAGRGEIIGRYGRGGS